LRGAPNKKVSNGRYPPLLTFSFPCKMIHTKGADVMSKSNKLTLTTINKMNQEYNERKTIQVCGKYDVQIDTKFRRSKIQKLILDYYTVLQDLKKKENVSDETIFQSVSLINVLVISIFTDLSLPVQLDRIDNLIKMSEVLLDTGIMEDIFNQLPQDQVELLNQEINKSAKGFGNLLGEYMAQSAAEQTSEG
jgi:hypothetical protein